ncbi:MAG TPA: YihY/virulence factor BrkB family protein [Tenuifilaceae bacterium]|nr:YihY/virulence factor BrkB family protein [Tenuifilaceae bacterium]HPE17841.1 YihY/virulence factor BrkB family protein [Tenuifilaceae bacterium]HPJ45316.1 YihY/virulence factor BrkB family protein [Tenuifilaceae bacterium]HPQ33559.1 YihY/virulence factor BrkB family protein [Tenuifilaceae bacterium]HRX67429.1 YihY/virulence factor BrkB family protein [Tenuifilaceae bacterium]
MSLKNLIHKCTVVFIALRRKAKRIAIPGFDGVPIYYVVSFFVKGMIRGSVTTRASAVAFSFFVALFPTIIFLFTLLPFIPIENFQEQLLNLVKGLIPGNAFDMIETTLVDVVTRKSGGLLSFGFFAALFFSHNGINSLIDAFNASYHTFETRSFFAQHLVAFLLTILLPLLVTIAIILLFFGKMALSLLVDYELIKMNFTYYIIVVSQWIVIVALFFFSISFLYYLAPAKRTKFRFISTGAIMATVFMLVSSLGFSYFVNNFGQYNTLYGSIGSLLALMIWIYFNAIGLIVGFDLNASIYRARIDIIEANNNFEYEHENPEPPQGV